jgi:hypothetical protein
MSTDNQLLTFCWSLLPPSSGISCVDKMAALHGQTVVQGTHIAMQQEKGCCAEGRAMVQKHQTKGQLKWSKWGN